MIFNDYWVPDVQLERVGTINSLEPEFHLFKKEKEGYQLIVATNSYNREACSKLSNSITFATGELVLIRLVRIILSREVTNFIFQFSLCTAR